MTELRKVESIIFYRFLICFCFILTIVGTNISKSFAESAEQRQVIYEYGYNAGYAEGVDEKAGRELYEPDVFISSPAMKIVLEAIWRSEDGRLSRDIFYFEIKRGMLEGYADGYYGRAKKKQNFNWD